MTTPRLTELTQRYDKYSEQASELAKNPRRIAAIDDEKLNKPDTDGITLAYKLSVTGYGVEIFQNRHDLVSKLTPQGLNSPVTRDGMDQGFSALYMLTRKDEFSIEFLARNPQVVSMITVSSLNSSASTGPDEGRSPLWWLLAQACGRKLLVNNPKVMKKISAQGLCSVSKEDGKSPLWLLFNAIHECEYARTLINQHAKHLHANITKKGLNAVCKEPEGSTPLHALLTGDKKDSALAFINIKRAQFIGMIEVETLDKRTKSINENQSLLDYLANDAQIDDGLIRDLITGKPKIQELLVSQVSRCPGAILELSSNHEIMMQLFMGFVSDEQRILAPQALDQKQVLLLKRPDWIQYIDNICKKSIIDIKPTGEAFGTQANHNGDSLLNKLMSHPIGATLLHFNEETVRQIDKETLNEIICSHPEALMSNNEGIPSGFHLNQIYGSTHGISVCYLLSATRAGRLLLLRYPHLVDMINEQALNHMIDVGKHKGRSAALNLLGCPTGHAVLLANPSLFAKIPSQVLMKPLAHAEDTMPSTSESERPVDQLLESPYGRILLAANSARFQEDASIHNLVTTLMEDSSLTTPRELLSNITQDDQSLSMQAVVDLVSKPESIFFLSTQPQIATKIQSEHLAHIIKDGLYSGQSVLFRLLSQPEGIGLLLTCPQLIKQISEQAIHQVMTEGSYRGESCGHILFNTGLVVSMRYPELMDKIAAEHLNDPCQSERFENQSGLNLITANEDAHLLLSIDSLIDKVKMEGIIGQSDQFGQWQSPLASLKDTYVLRILIKKTKGSAITELVDPLGTIRDIPHLEKEEDDPEVKKGLIGALKTLGIFESTERGTGETNAPMP